VLVASEVALASVLLAGAALLGKSFEGLLAVDRGYDPTLVVSTGIVLPDNVYPTGASKREFFRAVFERLHATPGVTAAAAVNFLPSYGATTGTALVAGRPESTQPADRAVAWRVATPEYFAALRIPVVRGRGFDESDGPRGVPVAVVNRTLAERWFPGEDAVGKEIALTTWGPPSVVRVVGVTADVRHGGRTEATTPDVFLPYAQQSWGYMNIVVRGQRTTTTALLAALDRAVHAEDPSRPTFAAAVLEEMTDADVAQPKFGAALMGLFAAIAAALACIGVFGVMSHAVAERTREIGIRVALGGTPRQVLGLVMRPGLVLVLAGAATGLALALAGSRVLRSQLYGVRPTDPSVYALVALLMIAIGTAACFLPARRALGVAPTLALKAE
jgi:predicted permease